MKLYHWIRIFKYILIPFLIIVRDSAKTIIRARGTEALIDVGDRRPFGDPANEYETFLILGTGPGCTYKNAKRPDFWVVAGQAWLLVNI